MPTIPLLLVEDSEAQSALYAAYLPENQFEVVAVTSGEDALDLLTRREFALVLLDLHLPGIQGLEVLRRMAAAQLRVPVVVMTDSGSVDAVVEAMQLGASDFLAKPVEPGRLRLAVLAGIRQPVPAKQPPRIRPLAEVEREAIEAALVAFNGNVPRAAAALGVSPSTLYRKKLAWESAGGPLTGDQP